MSRNAKGVVLLGGLLVVVVVSFLALLRSRPDDGGPGTGLRLVRDPRPPFAMFRTLAPPDAYGRVAVLRLNTRDAPRRIAGLSCMRFHYAAGRGVCVVQETAENPPTYGAFVFDESFARGARFPLSGVPTRVRVAANGRRAAVTTYGEEERPEGERLATHSIIIDLERGRVLGDLREFQFDGGALLPAPNHEPLDFSSVAFAPDGDRFFATLTTATDRFLVAGSVDQRRLSVIRAGVASEALSPDGSHLAIKRLIGDRGFWQLGVIDLRTWSARDLQHGSRSVDDQVEWWDDRHVLYHDADGETTSAWILPIDGNAAPRVAIKDAYSVAVER